jgi:hypothetical protein
MVMKVRLSHHLPCFTLAAALALTPLAASAEDAPAPGSNQDHTMSGGMGGQDHMMGGGHDHMMGGGGMGGQDHMMGGGAMGGGQDHMMGGGAIGGGQDHMMGGGGMGGGQDRMAQMAQMVSMMREKLAHAGDRIESLKTALKITEAQTPAWDKFAAALLAATKSTMEQSIEAMQHEMAQRAAPAPSPDKGSKDYPDFDAINKTPAAKDVSAPVMDLPTKLALHVKMLKHALGNLEPITQTLDPLYASFSDEQKKIADGLRITPMGMM